MTSWLAGLVFAIQIGSVLNITKSVCDNAPFEMIDTTDDFASPHLSVSTQFPFGID